VVAAAPLRRTCAAVAIRRKRWARRTARERALPHASPERVALAELTRLVEQIEQEDSELAQRLELEALLDRHVTLTIAHQRALRAVMMGDRDRLVRIRDDLRSNPDADPRRLELCERRIRCHEQCEARVEHFAEELAVIDHLIRLAAQRALCPDESPPDDTIERRMMELDADEAARCMLAAEFH